jgi:hypothetical protein
MKARRIAHHRAAELGQFGRDPGRQRVALPAIPRIAAGLTGQQAVFAGAQLAGFLRREPAAVVALRGRVGFHLLIIALEHRFGLVAVQRAEADPQPPVFQMRLPELDTMKANLRLSH